MSRRTSILVTGGCGFVGSHFAHLACDAGADIVVLDDLSAGTRPELPPGARLVVGDIADRDLVTDILRSHAITAVTHFAARSQVGESVLEPAKYFATNVEKAKLLLDVVRQEGPAVFVFSSTAAVYGAPAVVPIREDSVTDPINPYGRSKLTFETHLRRQASEGLRWAALRYFNAAGAHPSGRLREDHRPETHLIPLALDASSGAAPELCIFGDDYPTRDGTCIRDYVHVSDLAQAHLLAIEALERGVEVGATNLGSGSGSTVLEILEACERATGRPVPYRRAARRDGDPPVLVADIARAAEILGWRPQRPLAQIIEDAARSRGGSHR